MRMLGDASLMLSQPAAGAVNSWCSSIIGYVKDLSFRFLGLSVSVSSAAIGRKEFLGLVGLATVGVVLCKYIDVALGTSRNSQNSRNAELRTRRSELGTLAGSAL